MVDVIDHFWRAFQQNVIMEWRPNYCKSCLRVERDCAKINNQNVINNNQGRGNRRRRRGGGNPTWVPKALVPVNPPDTAPEESDIPVVISGNPPALTDFIPSEEPPRVRNMSTPVNAPVPPVVSPSEIPPRGPIMRHQRTMYSADTGFIPERLPELTMSNAFHALGIASVLGDAMEPVDTGGPIFTTIQ